MPQALSSLKILDFSTLIPGPFATMVLADLGAQVIRIEAPDRGDVARDLPPGPEGGDSAWHGVLGRSKRSICLDLKTPGGSEIVRRLLESHDIVFEQFRPGVMERLGLDYETLASANPAVIYCSINSFGGHGALRQRAAHDINALALRRRARYRDQPRATGDPGCRSGRGDERRDRDPRRGDSSCPDRPRSACRGQPLRQRPHVEHLGSERAIDGR